MNLSTDKIGRIYIDGKATVADTEVLPILSLTDKENVIEELQSYAKTKGLHLLDNNTETTKVCYASKLNSLLIRADGRIGKCTVALYDDKNIVGKLNEDGTLVLDNEKLLWWARGLFSGDKHELACPLIKR